MEDDVIGKVVEVEKDIEEKIAIEKKMSQEWLENARMEAEKRVLMEEKALKGVLNSSVNSARLHAEKKAGAILRDAGVLAERFEQLNEKIVKKILLKYITRILPG